MLRRIAAMAQDAANWYPRWLCRREYKKQKFKRFNERPVEFAFVFRQIGAFYPLHVLDVGSGRTALPAMMRNCGPLVTATDKSGDYWQYGFANRHYYVIDDDICSTRLTGPFDLVTCISVLEHIEPADLAVRNMFKLLRPGGRLIVTCPYSETEYVRNVYELPESTAGRQDRYVTQSFSRRDVERWSRENDARVIEQEYWQCWEGRLWTQGKMLIPPRRVSVEEPHQLTCLLMQKAQQRPIVPG